MQDSCSRPALSSGPMASHGDYIVMTSVANLTCRRNRLHFLGGEFTGKLWTPML